MRTGRRTSGQTLVEFALIFPLFFLLIMGLFDLGRAVFYYATLNTAVREATRDAIVLPWSTASKDQVIEADLKGYLWTKELGDNCQLAANSVCDIDVAYLDTTKPANPYDAFDPKVLISVTYHFDPITPGIAAIVGSGKTIPMQVQSKMALSPVAKP